MTLINFIKLNHLSLNTEYKMSYTELSQEFYEKESTHFSNTRYCLWDSVKNFCDQFDEDDNVLDAGCGNGKNISYYNTKCNMIGIDKSKSLVRICKEKGYNVERGDITNTHYKDNVFHYIISIAVIHHISNETQRIQSIHEMMRILKPGGQLLVTLWAYESDEYSKKKRFSLGDNLVSFGKSKHMRYYYIYNREMCLDFCEKCEYNYRLKWDTGNWVIVFLK